MKDTRHKKKRRNRIRRERRKNVLHIKDDAARLDPDSPDQKVVGRIIRNGATVNRHSVKLANMEMLANS